MRHVLNRTTQQNNEDNEGFFPPSFQLLRVVASSQSIPVGFSKSELSVCLLLFFCLLRCTGPVDLNKGRLLGLLLGEDGKTNETQWSTDKKVVVNAQH